MISKRLLNKLQIGKKYLITDGIGFYILDVKENVIWCIDFGWSRNDYFGIYKKSWQDVLDENSDDRDFCYDIKYKYNKDNPTYAYSAHIMKLFVSASAYFSTYDLYFLGEYKENIDIKSLNKYCDIFKINYRWSSKKERLKKIYKMAT